MEEKHTVRFWSPNSERLCGDDSVFILQLANQKLEERIQFQSMKTIVGKMHLGSCPESGPENGSSA
jgi:hypothetical protein